MSGMIKVFIMKNSRIYIGTIIVSIGLIVFSFIPYGWKIWENILASIGCSGIAAAVMAIFLEMHDERKEEKRRKELRQTFLAELDSELRHLFERVLWFEGVLDKIDLSKDIEHYTSINFIKEAHSFKYYRQTKLVDCESEIARICEKYQEKSIHEMDKESISKNEKMFLIIGIASRSVVSALENIRKNQMFLIVNNIFTIDELNDIYVYVGRNIELLQTPRTNYGVPLEFLLNAYKRTHEMGNFDEDIMIVGWQTNKDLISLLIDERKKQNASIHDKTETAKRRKRRKKK